MLQNSLRATFCIRMNDAKFLLSQGIPLRAWLAIHLFILSSWTKLLIRWTVPKGVELNESSVLRDTARHGSTATIDRRFSPLCSSDNGNNFNAGPFYSTLGYQNNNKNNSSLNKNWTERDRSCCGSPSRTSSVGQSLRTSHHCISSHTGSRSRCVSSGREIYPH